jgi:serine protease Do
MRSAIALLALSLATPLLAGAAEAPLNPNIFVELSKKVVPSVVNIQTTTKGGRRGFGGQPGQPDDLFRKFFEDFFRNGGRRAPPEDEGDDGAAGPLALGTGFVIDPSGLILTNAHVVQDADEIKILFTEEDDEKPTDGKVVGRDPDLDLALIKVDTKRKLTAVALGDSDALEVGEYVMAVGNPFGQGHSVTHGIISAKGRKSPDFALARYLQTDAPINPGNSGGPLLNLKGEVVGINNAIDARAQGIGFAIPINSAKAVLQQLKSTGSVSRGYIGIQVNDLTPEIARRVDAPKDVRGCFVAHVYPGEPAETAGLRPYDIIVEYNGKKIASANDLIVEVTGTPVGKTAKVKALRNGKSRDFEVKVALRPTTKPEEKAKPRAKPSDDESRTRSGIDAEEITPEVAKELGVPDNTKGVVVNEIRYGSPADKAGLMRGDIIVEIDRKPVHTEDELY